MKTPRAAAGPEEIQAVVAPWLYGDLRSPRPPLARMAPFGPYSFDGWVRADLGPATAGTPAREVRAWLLKAAEDALDALTAAGWQLTAYPVMEFSGSLDYPAQQHSIGLRVRFEVNTP